MDWPPRGLILSRESARGGGGELARPFATAGAGGLCLLFSFRLFLIRAYDRESTHSPVGLNPNWSVARHDSRTWPTRPHPSQRALGAPGATALRVLDLDDFAARPTSSSLLEYARLRPEPTSSQSCLCRRQSFLYLLSLIHLYHLVAHVKSLRIVYFFHGVENGIEGSFFMPQLCTLWMVPRNLCLLNTGV